MGAFGIYFICLIFAYLIYYSVMILMDIYGKKGQKADTEEVFQVGGGAGTEEKAEQVLEKSDGGYEILGRDNEVNIATPIIDDEMSKEPILEGTNINTTVSNPTSTFRELQAAREDNTVIVPTFQDEVDSTELFKSSLNPMEKTHRQYRILVSQI